MPQLMSLEVESTTLATVYTIKCCKGPPNAGTTSIPYLPQSLTTYNINYCSLNKRILKKKSSYSTLSMISPLMRVKESGSTKRSNFPNSPNILVQLGFPEAEESRREQRIQSVQLRSRRSLQSDGRIECEMEVPGSSKKMTATQDEMVEARVPIPYRDQCAHLLIPLNKCRQKECYLPWKCEDERHVYEKCEYELLMERMLAMQKIREKEGKSQKLGIHISASTAGAS